MATQGEFATACAAECQRVIAEMRAQPPPSAKRMKELAVRKRALEAIIVRAKNPRLSNGLIQHYDTPINR